jgi:hypothetical protein
MEFFTVEGPSPIQIHVCLGSVHGDASSVRCWVSEIDSGDQPCSNWHSVASKGGRNVSTMKQTLWKKYLNFVRDIPMIYANFTATVTTVTVKKKK